MTLLNIDRSDDGFLMIQSRLKKTDERLPGGEEQSFFVFSLVARVQGTWWRLNSVVKLPEDTSLVDSCGMPNALMRVTDKLFARLMTRGSIDPQHWAVVSDWDDVGYDAQWHSTER
jgi:hypothetical protein